MSKEPSMEGCVSSVIGLIAVATLMYMGFLALDDIIARVCLLEDKAGVVEHKGHLLACPSDRKQ